MVIQTMMIAYHGKNQNHASIECLLKRGMRLNSIDPGDDQYYHKSVQSVQSESEISYELRRTRTMGGATGQAAFN